MLKTLDLVSLILSAMTRAFCSLVSGGPVVACAPLIESETITLRQYGEGEVSISQTSPFEYTTITNGRTREMVSMGGRKWDGSQWRFVFFVPLDSH